MKIVFFIKIKFIRFSNLFLHMLEHWIVVLCGFVKIQNGLNCFENGFEKAIKQKKKNSLSSFGMRRGPPHFLSPFHKPSSTLAHSFSFSLRA